MECRVVRFFRALGFEVLHGDGTRLEHTPYDAIVVAAGGPQVPESLKAQLKIGAGWRSRSARIKASQEPVRVTRVLENE
jgi:protein-L-isoaspartate(D-aspartate) O-methyltransferase